MARARAARRARGVPAERWLTGTVPRTPPGSFLRDLPPGDPQHDPSTRRAPHATQPHMLGKRSWVPAWWKFHSCLLEPFPSVVDIPTCLFFNMYVLQFGIVRYSYVWNASAKITLWWVYNITIMTWWHDREVLGIQILMKIVFHALRTLSVARQSNISACFLYFAKLLSNFRGLKWFCNFAKFTIILRPLINAILYKILGSLIW